MIDDYLSDRWVIYGTRATSVLSKERWHAEDALVVCAADSVGILELTINETLRRAKRWLDSRGLKIGP